MRVLNLLILMIGLLAFAAPSASATATVDGQEIQVGGHEEALDALLDETGAADEHLGHTGRCVRSSSVEAAKDLYGDDDGKDNPVDCLLSQCVGWPPNLYINDRNCIKMVRDLLGIDGYRSDGAGP